MSLSPDEGYIQSIQKESQKNVIRYKKTSIIITPYTQSPTQKGTAVAFEDGSGPGHRIY